MNAWSPPEVQPLLVATVTSTVQAGSRIALVLVGGYLGSRVLRLAISRLEAVLIRTGEWSELVPGSARRRATTLTGVLSPLGIVTPWAVGPASRFPSPTARCYVGEASRPVKAAIAESGIRLINYRDYSRLRSG